MSVYNPEYPPIPNAFFCYPWYGYTEKYMCYSPNMYQQTQQVNIQQLNAKMLELQAQQCCCNQITALNNRLSDMVNVAPVQCFSTYKKEEKKDFVYELDKILFPDNPIRDYIAEEVRKVKEKYAERIRELDSILT